jgi:hypothetical protein
MLAEVNPQQVRQLLQLVGRGLGLKHDQVRRDALQVRPRCMQPTSG